MNRLKNILMFSAILLFAALISIVRVQKERDQAEMKRARTIAIKDRYTLRTAKVIKDTPKVKILLVGVVSARREDQNDKAYADVSLQLFDEQAPLLKPGLQAVVTPSSLTGTVVNIDNSLDPQTKSTQVLLEVADPEEALPTGMFVCAVVDIPEDIPPLLIIPSSSILVDQGRYSVYVQTEPKQYQKRMIQIERSLGDWTAVKSGLSTGETVVVNGTFLIDSFSELSTE